MPAALASGPGREHRFLSVLFCDLVDSTGHQYRMGPEDFARLLTAYRRVTFEIIRRHGGHVAKVIGDGVLAYFGWPHGGGRDAEAAVFCALAIGERMERLGTSGELPTGTPAAVRIAVETGWVLVGNIGLAEVGTDEALEHADVIGHAPNVAARLQHLAPRNGVVVGETTLPLTAGRFDLEPVDTTGLTLPAPVRAARVTGRAAASTMLLRLGQGQSGPFFGREHELARLTAWWEEVKAGQGRVVMVSGEPGIGKSRLAASLAATAKAEAQIVVLTCSPATSNSVFQPLVEPLRLAMNLAVDASVQTILDEARHLARRFALTAGGDAIAAVLGVTSEQLLPAALRMAVFDVFLEFAASLAADRPLLVFADDLQWADASTLELLRRLGEQLEQKRIMLLITHRADWQSRWPAAPHMHHLALQPLRSEAAVRLVEALTDSLDKDLQKVIIERSEGVPFFIVEFARAIQKNDRGVQRLPGSISQLLSARLDSAGPAHELVQYACVVGREVEVSLLARLSGLASGVLAEQLSRILEIGIMIRHGEGRTARFVFRHALLADAAYEALTTDRRRALHQQVADALRAGDPALGRSEPEVLGRHLAMAGNVEASASLFHAAGTNALGTAAFVESEAHARHSLELARTLPGETGQRLVLAATVLLGEALSGTHGYASNEAYAAFEAANRIALNLGNIADIAPALRGIIAYYQIRGPLHRAHELGKRAVQIARITGDPLQLAEAERRWGWCRFCQGELAHARELVESAMWQVERGKVDSPDDPVVDDTVVRGPIVLALIAWFVDGDAEASRITDEIAAQAKAFPQPMTAVYGLGFASFLKQLCGQPAAAQQLAALAGEIARSRSNSYWIALTDIVRGWGEVVSGANAQAGLELIYLGLRDYKRTQSTILLPYALLLLAEAKERMGDLHAALNALHQGLGCAEAIGADVYRPLLEAAQGRLQLHLGLGEARAAPYRARTAAVRQGAAAQVVRIDIIAS